MHAKSVEVSQFIDKDLLPQVKDAFALYQSADKAEIEKDLGKAIEQAQGLGVDPETAQKGQRSARPVEDGCGGRGRAGERGL